MIEIKNKVIDYMTVKEIVEKLEYSKASDNMITQYCIKKEIENSFKFSNVWAIPVQWAIERAEERGVKFNGIELENDEVPVSLLDFIPLKDWAEQNGENYQLNYNRVKRGTFKEEYIRFGNTYGVRKN